MFLDKLEELLKPTKLKYLIDSLFKFKLVKKLI